MATMAYCSSFSIIIKLLLFAITSRQLAHAVTAADIEIQPTSIIAASEAVATGTESILEDLRGQPIVGGNRSTFSKPQTD